MVYRVSGGGPLGPHQCFAFDSGASPTEEVRVGGRGTSLGAPLAVGLYELTHGIQGPYVSE